MTTQQVADRFNELSQAGQWDKIQDELFAENATSVDTAMFFVSWKVEQLSTLQRTVQVTFQRLPKTSNWIKRRLFFCVVL